MQIALWNVYTDHTRGQSCDLTFLNNCKTGRARECRAGRGHAISCRIKWNSFDMGIWTLLGHSESGKRSNPPKLSGCTHGKLQWCHWFGEEWASMSYLIRGILLYYKFSPKKKKTSMNLLMKNTFLKFSCASMNYFELICFIKNTSFWIEL